MAKPEKLYTISDAVAAWGLPQMSLRRIVEREAIGLRTVGGTPILRDADLPKIKAARLSVGRPRRKAISD